MILKVSTKLLFLSSISHIQDEVENNLFRFPVALLYSRSEVFKNLMVNQARLGAGLTDENPAIVQNVTSQDFVSFLDFCFPRLYVVLFS